MPGEKRARFRFAPKQRAKKWNPVFREKRRAF